MPSVVDMHAHYVSPDLIDEVARNGDDYGVDLDRSGGGPGRLVFRDGPTLRPFFRELTSLSGRLPGMDETGVALQIVSGWTDMAGEHLRDAQAARWARLQNETLAADVARVAGRFAGMATLPSQDPHLAIQELDHALEVLGYRAVQLCSHAGTGDLDHPDYRPLWRRLAEHRVFVLLHPPIRPIGIERLGEYFMNNLFGFPADTTLAAGRLLFSGLLEELPGLKVCLAHGGGFLPYQAGRLDRGFAVHPACQGRITIPPSKLLERFLYDTLTHDDAALAYLVDRVGESCVVYGSDYPFEMLDPKGPDRVRGLSSLSPSAAKAILSDTMNGIMAGRAGTRA